MCLLLKCQTYLRLYGFSKDRGALEGDVLAEGYHRAHMLSKYVCLHEWSTFSWSTIEPTQVTQPMRMRSEAALTVKNC